MKWNASWITIFFIIITTTTIYWAFTMSQPLDERPNSVPYIASFNPRSITCEPGTSTCPIGGWGNWGSEEEGGLPKVVQLLRGTAELQQACTSLLMFCACHPVCHRHWYSRHRTRQMLCLPTSALVHPPSLVFTGTLRNSVCLLDWGLSQCPLCPLSKQMV